MHPTFLSRIRKPKLFADALNFEIGISPARKLCPIERQSKFYHLCRKITPITERTARHFPTVGVGVCDLSNDLLPLTQRHQLILSGFSVRVTIFGCINTKQSDLILLDNQSIAIDHVGRAFDNLWCWFGSCR